MTSPRCQSRESVRSPSEESVYSGRGVNTISPVGLALNPAIPQSLLPQHSAAMAAYFSAAAAAVQQNRLLTGRTSPSLLSIPSPLEEDSGVLDFSKKRNSESGDSGDNNSDNESIAMNLARKPTESSPLDLSVSTRKRTTESPSHLPRKKTTTTSSASPWTPPQMPFFASTTSSAESTVKQQSSEWNGKHKPVNEATKALEKMSELSRFGGEDVYRTNASGASGTGGSRHSAWQSHWLNKGADSAKDVLKCVWCKQSFTSLAALTTHMKETKHCGVSVPPPANPPPASTSKPNQNDLSLIIKETMPLPRKLVRGQDVWLGKGAEQTRQILKCMWCGQSFRSLAEMTTHMQQTQHYTNIISQEQIISWKSAESSSDKAGSGSESSSVPLNTSSTVSAVLTCKVCDQAFSSLKELSNHMVKNAHYKEHIMRSITESGGRRRQTREKRKKSLPVRKLLELERAQNDFKNGELSPVPKQLGAGRITCEKCNDKIETSQFVEHIRLCVGGILMKKNSVILPESISPVPSSGGRKSEDISSPVSVKSPTSETSKSLTTETKTSSSSVLNAIEQLIEKSFDTRTRHANNFGQQQQTPLGASILKRLGIDESVDYTKPLVDPQTMNLLKNYHSYTYSRPRSGSESSSVSERGSSRIDSLTPEKKYDTSDQATPRNTPDKSTDEVQIKKEDAISDDDDDDEENASIKIKRECHDDDNEDHNDERELSKPPEKKSDVSPRLSPESPSSACSTPTEKKSSLGALSSMFDSLTGPVKNNNDSTKKGNAHPLAALQKLCDKTETTAPTNRSSSSTTTLLPPRQTSTAGSLLAFSWACNDAVTEDAVVKCAYCDTSFNTKGAYRHHLSKVHFVDNTTSEDIAIPKIEPPESPKTKNSGNGVPSSSNKDQQEGNKSPGRTTPKSSSFDESPHSKFLKYTELAKQLSSKYV